MVLTNGRIIKWETNKTEPMIRMYPRILSFLGYDPHDPPKTTAEQLLAKRRRLGISRRQMATMFGVDPGTLAEWELGRSEPIGDHALTVTTFLNE